MRNPSALRQVTRHLALELAEVARDLRHIEASENRFLRLTVEQEPEGCLEAALRRVLARSQPLARLSRHRDVVTGLALSLGHDHLEHERIALAGEPDLDHVDLLGRIDLPRDRAQNLVTCRQVRILTTARARAPRLRGMVARSAESVHHPTPAGAGSSKSAWRRSASGSKGQCRAARRRDPPWACWDQWASRKSPGRSPRRLRRRLLDARVPIQLARRPRDRCRLPPQSRACSGIGPRCCPKAPPRSAWAAPGSVF